MIDTQHGWSPERLVVGGALKPTTDSAKQGALPGDTPSRLVRTNEEAGGNGQITTVTLEERAGQTLLVVHDLYPSKEALDEDIGSGSTSWNDETFDQLDELLGSATSKE